MSEKPTYEELEQRNRELEKRLRIDSPAESHQHYRKILDCSPSVIYTKDLKGCYTSINKEFENLSGLKSEYVIGKTDFELFPSQVAENSTKNDKQVIQTGTPIEIEEYGPVGGEMHTFISIKYPLLDEEGKVYGICGVSSDITEQKNAEGNLRQSEEKYRQLVKYAPTGPYEIDFKNNKIITVNDVACKYTGYTEQELLEMSPTDLLTPKSARNFTERLQRMFAGENVPQTVEYQIQKKNGGTLWAELNVQWTYDKGEIIGATVVAHDITDRKRDEEEKAQLLARLQTTLDATADGILVVSSAGRIVAYNKRFMKFWEIPEKIMETEEDEKALSYVFDKLENPDSFFTKVRQLYANPKEISFDTIKFKDGRIFERYSRPHFLNERIVGRVWSFRDVTEKKNAEARLKESEKNYRMIFENSIVGIFESTPEGRFIRVNSAFCSMLKYDSPEDLIFSISDIATQYYVDPETRKRFKDLLQKNGHIENFEFKAKCKDLSEIWVSNSTRAYFDETGNVLYYEGVVVDISKRKEIEQEKDALITKLKKANEEIKQLRGIIPICSICKKVRDDKGYWSQIEAYISQHSEAQFSHGICQDCADKFYSEMDLYGD